MDWKSIRQEKLAKAASYKPSERRGPNWWSSVDRFGEWWGRFMMLSWWEKGMVIGVGVLLALLGPMAVLALAGGDDSAVLAPATDTPSAIVVDIDQTQTPIPTKTPKAVPATLTPTPENRKDCDDIKGTPYLSDDERDWYDDNCFEPEPTDTPTAEPQQTQQPQQPQAPQAPTDTPAPSMSVSEAKSLAAGWIRSNPVYAELQISAGSCIAQASGGGWVVSCTGTTTGCTGAACSLTIRVCVTDSSVRQC